MHIILHTTIFLSKLPSTRQTFSILTTDRLYNCLTSVVKDLPGCASARAANNKCTLRVYYVSRVDRIPAAGRRRVGAHSGSEHLVDDGIMRLAGLDDLLVFFRRTGRRGGPVRSRRFIRSDVRRLHGLDAYTRFG